MNNKQTGFTLIELMIVVAVIGILTAVAIPKMGSLVRKSREASTKANLGSIRSALSIYYADNEGKFPTELQTLAYNKKYLPIIPNAWTQESGDDNTITNGP